MSLNAGYEFSVYKSKTCKVICDQVDDFKKWTEGPSLGVSLMVVL